MEQVLKKCWYQRFEQLPDSLFRIFFSISRNFTKDYLHAKFQTNWTIQTEIRGGGGGRICLPPTIPICKKPGLFTVKITFQADELLYGDYEKNESDFRNHVQKNSKSI